MKTDIHPEYVDCTVTCGCGNSFQTHSTVEQIKIEICSECHPFYTGKQKFVDTAGRVERFQRKYQWTGEVKKGGKKAEDAAAPATEESAPQTHAEQLEALTPKTEDGENA